MKEETQKQQNIENDEICQTDNIVRPDFTPSQSKPTPRVTAWGANSGNDEFYTPAYAIEPILKYIKPNSTIWCPFDLPESWYVIKLTEVGHNVIATHIETGEDFFTTPVPKCDYIISNPPYSLKIDILQRLFDIGIPFMMLVGIAGLFESQRKFDMFKSNEFEMMYFNRKIAFFKNYAEQKSGSNAPFGTAYVCSKVLPKQIVFEELNKPNAKKNTPCL